MGAWGAQVRTVRGLSKCALGVAKPQKQYGLKLYGRVGYQCPEARAEWRLIKDVRVFLLVRVAWVGAVCTGRRHLGALAGAASVLALFGLRENVSNRVRGLFYIIAIIRREASACGWGV